MARVMYPFRTSKTCCQGLVDLGFLNSTVLPTDHCLMQSGITLLLAQSPPPITFPARAIPIFIFFLLKIKLA